MNVNQDKPKSINVSHSPAIIEYSKSHSSDPLTDNFRISAIKTIFSLVQFLIIYYLSNNFKLIKGLIGGDCCDTLKEIIYYFMIFFMLFTIQNLILNTLRLFSAIYKLKYPTLIFLPSFLKNFSKNIAIIIAWSLSLYAISFKEFLKSFNSQSTELELDFFNFLSEKGKGQLYNIESSLSQNIQKSISESKIFYFIIPMLVKIYVVISICDFITFFLNYLVHYKYYEKRIIENTEKITLLRNINDVAKTGYNIDIEETSRIVFQTLSIDGEQSIKLFDLNKFFDEATAHKIFEFCNGIENEEITQDEIYMFYVSTLTEQMLLEKSICSNSSTVKSFRNVLDVCVFMLSIVVLLTYFPVLNTDSVEPLKGPLIFLSAILSANYSFGDAYRSFFNSLNFIFFVRPYEIGDFVVLNGVKYEVAEINLLTSIFYDGCSFHVIPNSSIFGSSITNMRLNRIWEEDLRFKFSFSDFEAKKDEFLQKLTATLKKKTSEYKKKPYYSNVVLVGSDKVDVVLTVQINTSAVTFEKIRERRNSLVFKVQNLFKEIGLNPI